MHCVRDGMHNERDFVEYAFIAFAEQGKEVYY